MAQTAIHGRRGPGPYTPGCTPLGLDLAAKHDRPPAIEALSRARHGARGMSMTIENSSLSHIQNALTILREPGSVSELRILVHTGRTLSGYYEDQEKMAQDAARMSGKHPGVYMTLNPVNPDLKGRAYNRLQDYAKQTTADTDILHRIWLPCDFDPVRPSGVSATEQE